MLRPDIFGDHQTKHRQENPEPLDLALRNIEDEIRINQQGGRFSIPPGNNFDQIKHYLEEKLPPLLDNENKGKEISVEPIPATGELEAVLVHLV